MEVSNQQVTELLILIIAGRVLETQLPSGSGWWF